ncbi:MAG: hypothetical protein R3C03_02950 [Pirellulaceae bacterium]
MSWHSFTRITNRITKPEKVIIPLKKAPQVGFGASAGYSGILEVPDD